MLTLEGYLQVLLSKLGIPLPDDMGNRDVFSLEIGRFTYHFKVHAERYLTIYSLVGNEGDIVDRALVGIMNLNHFSDEEYSPVFAYDVNAKKFLIWNRQKVCEIGNESVLPQLEAMMAANNMIETLMAQGEQRNDSVALDIKAPHIGIRC